MKITLTGEPLQVREQGAVRADVELPGLVDDPVPVGRGPELSQGAFVVHRTELEVPVLSGHGLGLDPLHKDPALPFDDLLEPFPVVINPELFDDVLDSVMKGHNARGPHLVVQHIEHLGAGPALPV